MAPKRSARRRNRRRGGRRRKTTSGFQQMTKDNNAVLSSTINKESIAMNTMYDFSHTLAASTRAVSVATNYQFYKIDYVEIRIKPYADTYLQDISGNPKISSPQLYFFKSKTAQSPSTLAQLRLMGVNPKPFARDGNWVFRYKPAVEVAAEGGTNFGAGILRVSPWLGTSSDPQTFAADDTPHYGACFYIASEANPTYAVSIATLEVETHFRFKQPNLINASQQENITNPKITLVV